MFRTLLAVRKELANHLTLGKKIAFGLYLKQCRYPDGNEGHALKIIEAQTSIPAPLLVDSFQDTPGISFRS